MILVILLWFFIGAFAGFVATTVTMRLNAARFYAYVAIGAVSGVIAGALYTALAGLDWSTVYFTQLGVVFLCSIATLAAYRILLFKPQRN